MYNLILYWITFVYFFRMRLYMILASSFIFVWNGISERFKT